MKCEKCGGEWTPPKNISVSLTNCPFCGAPILNVETASSYTEMDDLLKYLVSLYGAELYKNRQKLSNLIADFYRGDERLKRAYRRAILEDTLAQRVYELSLKPLNEREAFCNQIISQFVEANFYSNEFGKQLVNSFTSGLQLEIIPPIPTKATEEDGRWEDEFVVIYSADRKKLIKGNRGLKSYNVREWTSVICEDAFRGCTSLTSITIPDSVTTIGNYAFFDCTSLTSIIIPDSVTTIGKGAFVDCVSLTSITIPDSITTIGDHAFYGCTSLTSIYIPKGTTEKFKRLLNSQYHDKLKEV